MASLVTLAELRATIRRRIDYVNDDVVTDDELLDYINASLAELWDLLVGVDSQHVVRDVLVTLTGSTGVYAIADDFYKIKKVDLLLASGVLADVRRTNQSEKNRWSGQNWLGVDSLRDGYELHYDLVNQNLEIYPAAATGAQVKVRYYPTAPVLAEDADSFDSINRFDEYVVADVALKVALKLDISPGAWGSIKDRVEARVKNMAQDRDMGDSWGMTRHPRRGGGRYGGC